MPPAGLPPLRRKLAECSDLEAATAERAWAAQEAAWTADPDWRKFLELCYPHPGPPTAEALHTGVRRLKAVAARGHALAAHQLATELHVGRGRLGLAEDPSQATRWYTQAIRQGHPLAAQHLRMLHAAHPELHSGF